MNRLTVLEYEPIRRSSTTERTEFGVSLSERDFDRLRDYDERAPRSNGKTIFTWKGKETKARQWVGIIELPHLSIEILPKIAHEEGSNFAKRNLFYMLSVAGKVPIRDRELASQDVENSPIMESLIRVFAERFSREIHRGLPHQYIAEEENLPLIRGKLLIAKHLKTNMTRPDRFYVSVDSFSPDHLLNRILRECCQTLLPHARRAKTQRLLRSALIRTDGISDVTILRSDFDCVKITRQNERFKPLIDFAKMVFDGTSPTSSAGRTKTFSLLFDMNAVFEAFLGSIFRKYVVSDAWKVREQGQGGKKRYLVYNNGDGVTRMKPDIILYGGKNRRVIIDAKWKTLREQKSSRMGVTKGDMQQLFTYAHHYDCRDVVLLYPEIPGSEEGTFDVNIRGVKRSIHIRFVDLSGDLRTREVELVEQLKTMVGPWLKRADFIRHVDAPKRVNHS